MPLTRLSLEERIRCVRFFSMCYKTADIQKKWRQEYGTDPPSRKTINSLNKKFNETGSVADLSRSGRPKTSRTAEKVALVEEAIKQDPTKSIRILSHELGVNKAAVHRIRKEADASGSTLRVENKKLKEKIKTLKNKIEQLEKTMNIKPEPIQRTAIEIQSHKYDSFVPCVDSSESEQLIEFELDTSIKDGDSTLVDVEIGEQPPNQSMSITMSPSNAVINSQVLHLQPVQVLVQQHSDISHLQPEITQMQISPDSIADCTMYHITN